MSLLSKTKTKLNVVKEELSPLSRLGVMSIEIEDGFAKVFDTIDPNKLMDINLSNTDLSIPLTGTCGEYYTDLYRRLVHYVCDYFIDNKTTCKLRYDDIIRNDRHNIPILLILSITIENNNWINRMSIVLPNGKRLNVNYKIYE